MNTPLRKVLAGVAAFFVLGLIATLAGSLEGIYRPLFPDLSETSLANIEATSNIVGLTLAIWLSIRVYKRLAKTQGSSRDKMDT